MVLTEIEGGEKTGKVQLKDGSFAMHMVVPSGIFSGTAMIEAAEAAKEFGNGEIRLTVSQNLYILGVNEENIEKLLNQPIYQKYKNVNSPYFNDVIACAGLEHCPFGVIPNKPDAIKVAKYLTENYPADPSDAKIRMYWSACPKGCGIHGNGDIGFVGVKFKKDEKLMLGTDIYYGGTLTGESEEGKLLIKAVPLDKVQFYVEEIVKEYLRLKSPKESFEKFHKRVLSKVSKYALRFLIIFNNLIKRNYPSFRLEINESVLNKSFEEEEIFSLGFQLYKKITGKNPYTRNNILEIYDEPLPENPSQINPEIPKGLDEIVLKMIHKNPAKRYKAFTEIEKDLEDLNI